MIKVIKNGCTREQDVSLPFTLASISRIEGRLEGQEVNTECKRMIFYKTDEKVYLAIVRPSLERGRPHRVAKIFALAEEEKFEFVRNGRCLFYTLTLSIGQLRIFSFNERLDVSNGADEKFEEMIIGKIEERFKKRTEIPKIIRRKVCEKGETS